MASGGNEILTLFLSSFQAAISVLLTLSYGILATRLKFIDQKTSKDISQLCVNMFLPALLITNIGKELKLENLTNYIPVFLWAFIYPIVSFLMTWPLKKFLKLPDWVVPAVCFNNTTSLPLLLTQALGKTSALNRLAGDDVSEAINRANSYFLINSMVSNVLTFMFGPKLFSASKSGDEEDQQDGSDQQDSQDERDPLLPRPARRAVERVEERIPDGVKDTAEYVGSFFSPTLIGAIIAVVIGLIPPVQNQIFEGVFSAWLTASLSNIGELFTALQMFIVGSKLHESLFTDQSEGVPKMALAVVGGFRFVVWGLISVPLVWLLAGKGVLGGDPMLWWSLCLMPVGPPAMILGALTDVANMGDKVKMQVARLLTYMYAFSPMIFVVVAAALKVCQNVQEKRE